jgi:hypothetical protein
MLSAAGKQVLLVWISVTSVPAVLYFRLMQERRKDPAAVALGKKRAAKLKKVDPGGMRDLGALGGQRRADNLSPEKRSEIAKRAAAARWAKKKGK